MNREPTEPSRPDHNPTLPASRGLDHERLWTPWRMRYVAGGNREPGCIFCNRLAENDDVQTLILHRGDRAFVIMNLFPYNTGHVMIVPNAHIASPEDADPEMLAEMAALRGPVLRALRRALAPEGFNLGLNIGAVAGAGVTDHLHEHIVPRWQGDANFMPILGATMVMPELIPVTYAKLRAELERELRGSSTVTSLALSRDSEQLLVDASGELPHVTASHGEPLWRASLRDTHDRGAVDAELLGWAGEPRAGAGEPALLLRASFSASDGLAAKHHLANARQHLAGPTATMVQDALRRLELNNDK